MSRDFVDLLFIGGLSLALGAAFIGGVDKATHDKPQRVAGAFRLAGTSVDVDVERATGHVTVRSRAKDGGKVLLEGDIGLWIDGEVKSLALHASQVDLVDRRTLEAHFPLMLPTGRTHAVLRLSLQPGAADLLVASVAVSGRVPETTQPEVAPTFSFVSGPRPLFVSGVGEVGDIGTVAGDALSLEGTGDASGVAIGVVSSRGGLTVDVSGEVDRQLHVLVIPPATDVEPTPVATDLALVVSAPGAEEDLWGALYAFAGEPTALVRGFVTGTKERSTVFGMGDESAPEVRVMAGADGRFAFQAPKTVTHWYAALDPSRTSPAVDYVPGAGFDLKLDVSPGGELLARIEDGDTGQPLTARLIVHGIDGTLDPSFGPDYRASGAGPLMDALHGDVATPLPAGHYRVAATRGLEWSIDAQTVEILPGRQAKVVLRPRHVVATPGQIDCDLHVHARPSFDSPVSPEDRILSLVAAGIEFAVPTEHNLVGDYSGPLETLGMSKELATVTGTEVTTYSPSFGHFGVFPLPAEARIPFTHTTIGAIFAAAKKGDPNRVLVVHHPRLGRGLGYFSLAGFDPKGGENGKPRVPSNLRTDFDAVEVYNGYEFADEVKVEAVMRDYYALLDLGRYAATGSSDSHRIQYLWAGYPRTVVRPRESGAAVGDPDFGPDDAAHAPLAIVRAVKDGRSFVTSGPYLELTMPADSVAGSATAGPGDTAVTHGNAVRVHVVVRAAPWVDVSSLEIVSGGESVARVPIEPRAEELTPGEGTLAEVQARAVRFDGDIDVVLPEHAHWLLAVARGTRKLDDILPFMPVTPLGMTNPVYLDRRP